MRESKDWQGKVYHFAKSAADYCLIIALFLFSINLELICMGVASCHILKAEIGAAWNFGDKNSNHVTKQPHITQSTRWQYPLRVLQFVIVFQYKSKSPPTTVFCL